MIDDNNARGVSIIKHKHSTDQMHNIQRGGEGATSILVRLVDRRNALRLPRLDPPERARSAPSNSPISLDFAITYRQSVSLRESRVSTANGNTSPPNISDNNRRVPLRSTTNANGCSNVTPSAAAARAINACSCSCVVVRTNTTRNARPLPSSCHCVLRVVAGADSVADTVTELLRFRNRRN